MLVSQGAYIAVVGCVSHWQQEPRGFPVFTVGAMLMGASIFGWCRDIIREGTFEGHHTKAVQRGLRIGVCLFIVSEAMFFLALFWAFFHSSLSPVPEIGGVWPPKGIATVDPWKIPLANSFILIYSGISVTWAHRAILVGDREQAIEGLGLAVLLACLFTLLQLIEYGIAPFSAKDSVYGALFYLITGSHGFHVFVGTAFLVVCLGRLVSCHFTRQHHVGFEAASWYWHFVDAIWILVFVIVYWWGS